MEPKNKCWIVTKNKPFFEAIGKYNYCSLEDMKLTKRIAYDSETTGLDPKLDNVFCVQLATKTDNYIIDLQDYTTSLKFKEYEGVTQYIEEVFPYLVDRELVGHNITFDLGFLYMKNFYPKVVFDTMIGSKILHNGEPPFVKHNFKDVMERELGLNYIKTDQKNINVVKLSQPSTILYSFNDVDRLLELHENLHKKLEAYKAIETYLIHCRYIRALAYMELCGMPINTALWKKKMEEDSNQSLLKALEIREYIYDNLPKYRNNQISLFDNIKKIKPEITSSKQMIPVFKDLGINVTTEEGKESIEEGVIQKSKHEFVKLWLEYQKANHRVTTFGENILSKVIYISPYRGRLYTRYNPIVDTGRISTRKGEINFLNFPSDKDTRKCFEANNGFKMIVSDYEGQENSTTADTTLDKVMLDSVINGDCLHCAFARVLYPEIAHLSDDEIKDNHSDKRKAAKAPRFALSFGGSAFTLATNLNISLKEAENIENAYKNLHKGIFEWANKQLEINIKQGYIENAAGFKLKLPFYDKFSELQSQIKSYSKQFWEVYREGKQQYKDYWQSINDNKLDPTIPLLEVPTSDSYKHYKKYKDKISEYFKLKSQYFRLTLNNPSQGIAAHQTKLAVCMLFEYIEERNHYWKARISNVVHD